jgi:hypothetical protein
LVVFFFGGPLIVGGIFSTQLVEQADRLSLYGISLPWLAVVLLYEIAVLFFVCLATRRRMESDRIHPLSKPQAIAGLFTLAVLGLGGIWGQHEFDLIGVAFLYVLVVISLLLVMMVTPNRSEYLKGLWRARKQGRTYVTAWDDFGLNRLFLMIACAIVLVSATMAWNAASGAQRVGIDLLSRTFPLAIANAVLTIAYFGLALQFFSLWIRVRGLIFFSLFLFVTWLVPILAGAIVSAASMGPGYESQIIFSLSPVGGIGLITGNFPDGIRTAVQASALTPALLFTFVFNSLYNMARRRVHDDVMITAENPVASTVSVGLSS